MTISNLHHSWLKWRRVMVALDRVADLKRLVKWAERKRLPGPRAAYERKLHAAVNALLVYKSYYPGLVKWAHRLHWLKGQLSPPPRYWSKGSAAKYRTRSG